MVRTMSITFLALAFLPIAIFLLLFGIERVNHSRAKGYWLKSLLIVNSALVIALGLIGCKDERLQEGGGNEGSRNGNNDKPLVTCYIVAPPDKTEIPDGFEKSADWADLEYTIVELERQIDKGIYDEKTEEKTKGIISETVQNLQSNGLLTEDEVTLVWAYCLNRVEKYNSDMVVSCYAAMPSPGTKEGSKKEIVEATIELRGLYRDGKIDTPAYNTTLATLETELAVYTGKKDNAVLRQLLLDLADGVGGSHYR